MVTEAFDTKPSAKLSAIDIFAGAGGLSLGLKQAGFRIEAAIEIDEWAATTFEKNYPDTRVYRENIAELSDNFFKPFVGIDALIGGPPCQGFSISASSRRTSNDPRNYCYRDFLRVVSLTQPTFVLIENVKEFGRFRNDRGGTILQEVLDFLDDNDYYSTYRLLNAKNYGVPQERIRFFLLASKYSRPEFPTPSHSHHNGLFGESKQLTLWDAISDLPEVTPRVHKEDEVFDYPSEPHNQYQAELRHCSSKIYNHIPMRHTARIIRRFSMIKVGERNVCLPEDLRPYCKKDRNKVSRRIYDQNHRRLDPHRPCSTITASFYSSFIHPFQHRNITVREAARVQGFPDSFIFYGKKTRLSHKLLIRKGIFKEVHLDQFNQVGNAVPPILAAKLAKSLLRTGVPK